jgi:hypothetical protein
MTFWRSRLGRGLSMGFYQTLQLQRGGDFDRVSEGVSFAEQDMFHLSD